MALIAFLIITPLSNAQLSVTLPKKSSKSVTAESPPSILLTVDDAGALALDGTLVSRADLLDRLRRAMDARSDAVVFFDASDDTPYETAMDAFDLARSGAEVTISVLPDKFAR